MKSQSILLELLHFFLQTKTEAAKFLLKKASCFRENGAGGGIWISTRVEMYPQKPLFFCEEGYSFQLKAAAFQCSVKHAT
jgi:hypothetical protein